ncbi:MAG: hypothetical protein AB7H97_00865 [Pseudobdellovibrionaceae bacterium]
MIQFSVVLLSLLISLMARATEFKTIVVSEKGAAALESYSTQVTTELDCKENIRKVVCLVDPVQDEKIPVNRICLEGSANYAHFFEEIHDVFPSAMQKMFCSLKKIYIEKQFFGTAYAGELRNEQGEYLGAAMGIRKSVLDESLNLHQWASWKEQLSFGGIADSYATTENLPFALTQNQRPDVNDFLYFVIAHEFGHFLDFANGVNRRVNCPQPQPGQPWPECEFAEGTWGLLSWATSEKVLP